ncbi:uncharacterized protein LOC121652044 isoform X2 [Melanotaenia boesemani]|uniref:uncharacterized protein LOC121652044 isoform X2 n=1 Tax=Melanotaenia boesemani TaxID=1250792 RepID=UPI001C04ED2E|nr:uncharacterized protein LOC121652044 isoform X2 [Melanotaenia boesemani]
MKFPFVLILLVDIPYLKGQQRIEVLQHILLRLSFPPFYNSYMKSCCKLYHGGCYKLMDNTGFTCEFLRGRVTKTEKDGWIEFKIINVQFVDGGYYRCGVLGAQTQIYSDYYVEVFASDHHRHPEPPLTTTVKVPNSSPRHPDSTGPALSEDRSDDNRASWSFGLPLAVLVSITVMIFVSAMIAAVCFRVKAKCKKSDTYEETLSESLTQEAPFLLGDECCSLHNDRLHSSPGPQRNVCQPEDAKNTSKCPGCGS